MKAFQAKISTLEGADTQVLGVSMDSPFSNFQFANQTGASFPLLSDWGGETVKKYGLEDTHMVQGIPMTTARRATYLIDKSGKIIEESVDKAAIDPTTIVDACQRVPKK